MTERLLVDQLIATLKADPALRSVVIFKHNDAATAGIPDLSVSVLGSTNWIELKYLRRGKRLQDIIKPLQAVTCCQLALTCQGRCWIVVYEEKPKRVVVWQPQSLAAYLWPKSFTASTAPATRTVWNGPEEFNEKAWSSVRTALNYCGAIWFSKWPHERVVQLVCQVVKA